MSEQQSQPAPAAPPPGPTPVVDARGLRFRWRGHRDDVVDIEVLTLAPGERVFLRGASGAGKSTLLGLLCGVLAPSGGRVELLGQPFGTLPGARRDALRAEHIGVVFQLFNLLPYLSTIGNVTLPCTFSEGRRRKALAEGAGSLEAEAARLLARLGLDPDEYAHVPVRRLSVGQQQRVAAARALIGHPELILADEPTSALDVDVRDQFVDLLAEQCARSGATLLFVSHDASLAPHFDRTIDLPAVNRAARRRRDGDAP